MPLVLRGALEGAAGWDSATGSFKSKEARANALAQFLIEQCS
jgi:hypothetical protein